MSDLTWLALLAIPVACASWTIAKEFIFQEFRDWCKACSDHYSKTISNRLLRWFVSKLFYLPRCYFCTSFYVTEFFMLITGTGGYLVSGWRGLVGAWFTVVFISQFYLTAFNILRVALRHYQSIADLRELELKAAQGEPCQREAVEGSSIKLVA